MTRNRLTLLGIAAAIAVLAADQASKWWILEVVRLPDIGQVVVLPVLNLTMVWNRGVSFGMFAGAGEHGPWLLMGLAAAVAAFLLIWLYRETRPVTRVALWLVLAGAVGNTIDRVRYGAVVDFLDFHLYGHHWPAFNIADMAIVGGVAVLLFLEFTKSREKAVAAAANDEAQA